MLLWKWRPPNETSQWPRWSHQAHTRQLNVTFYFVRGRDLHLCTSSHYLSNKSFVNNLGALLKLLATTGWNLTRAFIITAFRDRKNIQSSHSKAQLQKEKNIYCSNYYPIHTIAFIIKCCWNIIKCTMKFMLYSLRLSFAEGGCLKCI